MLKKKYRVIFDTNIWIRFLINKDFRKIDKYIENKQIIVLFSEELITEFLDVARRPYFSKFFNNIQLNYVLKIIEKYGVLLKVNAKIKICRDFEDNFILDLAEQGKCDFLISSDNDLLILKKIGKSKIITIDEFLYLMSK